MATTPQASSTNPRTSADKELKRDMGEASDALKREGQAASDALHDAAEAMRSKASQVASEAKAGARNQAEAIQGETSEALHVFADAARGAGARLKESDHGTAARLVHEAASGLDQISDSLRRKRLEEVAEDVRIFGRQNPTAFIAASVLAGIAIGRFMRSSAPDSRNYSGERTGNSPGNVGRTQR